MAAAAIGLLRPRAATTVVPTSFFDGGADRADGPGYSLAEYTSATPVEENHESGWQVRIRLDRQGRSATGFNSCWRSGEVLKGTVEIERRPEGSTPSKRVSSVIVRAYWQSSTVYTGIKIIQEEPGTGILAKLRPAAASIRAVAEQRGDWHRSELEGGGAGIELWHGGELEEISREVEGDFPLLGTLPASSAPEPPPPLPAASIATGQNATDDPTVLPFAFNLPTTSRVNLSSSCNAAPANRRTLQRFVRTPPPSLPGTESSTGIVEWIVEALVRFEDPASIDSVPLADHPTVEEVLPGFNAATCGPQGRQNVFAFASSTPELIVHRVVFPFEPMDQHAQDLYSAWRPLMAGPWSVTVARFNGLSEEEVLDDRECNEPEVPLFGRDPRDEALGGSHMGPKRAHRSRLVDQEGGRDAWRGYEKRMAIKSRLGRVHGWLRSEIFFPHPPLVSRHDKALELLMHLSVTLPENTAGAASTPPRLVAVDKVVMSLSRRILTRGGRDERPTFALEELRRHEIKLWDDETSLARLPSLAPLSSRTSVKHNQVEDGRNHLRLPAGGEGIDMRLALPLQTVEVTPQGKQTVPARDFSLSLRTPNVEAEYIVSVTLHPVGQPSFYAARVPIQIIAGDLMDVPSFTAHGGAPLSTPAPIVPESIAHDDLPAYA